MRIIHLADVHLDSALKTHYGSKKAKEKQDELLKIFSEVIDQADHQSVDAILISGDLFDANKVKKDTKSSVVSMMKNHPGIEFYYLRGNHDTSGIEEELENLHTFSANQYNSYSLKDSSVIISGIELDEDNNERIYDWLTLENNQLNIVMMHGMLSKSYTKGTININGLKNKGIDYLALGHIHQYETGEIDDRGKYCYPGCLAGRGFDEVGKHGYMLLDIDENKHLINDQWIEIPEGEVFGKTIDISECQNNYDIKEAIERKIENIDPERLINIILKGKAGLELDIDIDLLYQFLSHYPYLRIEDQSVYTIDYKQYIGESSLKGEFIEQVLQSIENQEDQEKIIHFGLKALRGGSK